MIRNNHGKQPLILYYPNTKQIYDCCINLIVEWWHITCFRGWLKIVETNDQSENTFDEVSQGKISLANEQWQGGSSYTFYGKWIGNFVLPRNNTEVILIKKYMRKFARHLKKTLSIRSFSFQILNIGRTFLMSTVNKKAHCYLCGSFCYEKSKKISSHCTFLEPEIHGTCSLWDMGHVSS